jgi:hypothetical protein
VNFKSINKIMTVIDFAPGTHGHFLEYVVNTYIFNINAPVKNLFQTSGAAHNINAAPEYQAQKMASSGHFSSYNHHYPDNTKKIIWIKHDPELDFVLLVNIFNRCHPDAIDGTDVNINEIHQLQMDLMFSSNQTPKSLRNDWYTKLQEHHLDQTKLKQKSDLPTFDFEYRSFFSLAEFIEQLQLLADFLNLTFVYNQSFIELYQEFIKINQGYQQYCTVLKIIDAILTNQPYPIDQTNWQIQSYINYRLSKLFKIYDGIIYSDDQYPKDANDIHKLVLEFVKNYDSRF